MKTYLKIFSDRSPDVVSMEASEWIRISDIEVVDIQHDLAPETPKKFHTYVIIVKYKSKGEK